MNKKGPVQPINTCGQLRAFDVLEEIGPLEESDQWFWSEPGYATSPLYRVLIEAHFSMCIHIWAMPWKNLSSGNSLDQPAHLQSLISACTVC